jgi:tetratricopeptide (TPR) repeat protein/predicted Ser/Thr protein kinase
MGSPADTIECPGCHHHNTKGVSRCTSCGASLRPSDATVTHLEMNAGWSRATRVEAPVSNPGLSLEIGSVIAGRYEILKLLGEGGMGAVYKARDQEVDRLVALKVIRPELAGHSSVLQRFKQELILARTVTHRNVIRIYDLGVAEGCRFITMEYIEGQDLSSILEERKLAPEEAVKILRQVCAALEAAHVEGVVHRDLKPQNIMLEASGRVVVMDFGLARSMEASGLTQAGAIMGTPAYMSPEQAKGMPADERSDIFALGIILYQMLTGVVPFKAETAIASLLLRTQGPPPPPMQLEPAIPQGLNDIVLKALATDVVNRYQKAADLAKDLHDWEEGRLHRGIVTPPIKMMEESTAGKWIAIAVGSAIALAAAGYGGYRLLERPTAPPPPTTVIIADFSNHTGDAVFSGTLESTLKLALEGASFISAYDRTRMRDLGVRAIGGALDEAKAQEIAVNQALNVVVSGSLDRRGSDYQLSLRAIRAATGKVITTAEATAPGKDQVLFAVSKLGTAVRKALGDATSESAQRASMETATAASLEAVHEWAAALDFLSRGDSEKAQQHYLKALDLDPNFGLAYVGLAASAHNLGRQQDAEKYIKAALNHIDHMTERERFRTRGFLYYVIGDTQKCVDEYGTLLAQYPSDTGAYNNMADCSTRLRNLPKALEEVRHAVAILPKRAVYHVNVALYSAYAGDFQTAAKEAAATLQLNPEFFGGFLAQAFADLGQDQLTQAADDYQKVAKSNPSFAAIGLADLALYEGRFSEAAKMLTKGAADDLGGRAPKPDAAANKFAALAYVQLQRGQKSAALDAAKRALELSNAVKIRFLGARIYAAAGEIAKARELAAGLASEVQIEPQAYGKLIEGEADLIGGDARGAVTRFAEANKLLDTWIGRFDLGKAYLEAGAFPEADSEFDRCIKRRGESLALFLDEMPTYGYFPPVYYYQGRVREALKSSGFTESYKRYMSIRGKAGEDPLLADVRRRAGP